MTEASARETLENLAPDNLNWYSEYTENREKKSRIKKIIIAAVLCLSLIGSGIRTHSDTAEESPAQAEVMQEERHWRFYSVDLWVLGIGGGFCTVMILREKRKARETLK